MSFTHLTNAFDFSSGWSGKKVIIPKTFVPPPKENAPVEDGIVASKKNNKVTFAAPIDHRGRPIPLNLQLHGHVQGLPTKPAVAAMLPYYMTDLLFLSLRLAIYQVSRKSATPIARLIRDNNGDAELYCLLADYRLGSSQLATAEPGSYDHELFEMTEVVTGPCAKFRRAIAKARQEHALNLRQAALCDVDLLYEGKAAKVMTFRGDKEFIERSGGKAYMWVPLDYENKTISMSVIMSEKALRERFTAVKLSTGIVIRSNTGPAVVITADPESMAAMNDNTELAAVIAANTGPAATQERTPESQSCTLFPYEKPTLSASGIWDVDGVQAEIDRQIQRICAQKGLCNDDDNDAGNQAENVLGTVRKGEWNKFNSSLPGERTQPTWSPESHPFTKDFASVDYCWILDRCQDTHEWWLDDFEIRQAILQDWGEDNVSIKDGKVVRKLSNKPPQEAEAGKGDFPVIPGLCDTYVADRNHDWHRQHIANGDEADNRRKLDQAEARLERQVKIGMHLYQTFQKLQAHCNLNPDLLFQKQYRQCKENLINIDDSIANTKQQVRELREQCALGAGIQAAPGQRATEHNLPEDFVFYPRIQEWERVIGREKRDRRIEFRNEAPPPPPRQHSQKLQDRPVNVAEPGQTPHPYNAAPVKQVKATVAPKKAEQQAAAPAEAPSALVKAEAVVSKSPAELARVVVEPSTIAFPAYVDPMTADEEASTAIPREYSKSVPRPLRRTSTAVSNLSSLIAQARDQNHINPTCETVPSSANTGPMITAPRSPRLAVTPSDLLGLRSPSTGNTTVVSSLPSVSCFAANRSESPNGNNINQEYELALINENECKRRMDDVTATEPVFVDDDATADDAAIQHIQSEQALAA